MHKIDIQQGNIVTTEMIDKLEIGMTRQQVEFIMGTPVLRDSFHKNRMDYIYTLKPGTKDAEPQRLHVLLEFDNEKLINIQHDIQQIK